MSPSSLKPALPDFILVYVLLYGAFGAASPYLPALVEERGIPPELIGVLFGAGTAVRLISAPVAALIADRTHAVRLTFAGCSIATTFAATGYLAANSFWPLLMVSLVHAACLAPTTNLADALALVASRRPRPLGFEYGWVRGAGSGAFIAASILAGWAIAPQGLGIIIWLQVLLLLMVPLALMLVPSVRSTNLPETVTRFRRRPAPDSCLPKSDPCGCARSRQSCAARHVLGHPLGSGRNFTPDDQRTLVTIGGGRGGGLLRRCPWLLRRFTPATAMAVAALAGALRWLVAALTTDIMALALIQPLHGITFALLHLACMRLLAQAVPDALAVTAQALYGTVGVGAATAFLTIVSGYLYSRIGAASFVVMSALCLAALPITRSLSDAPAAAAR